MRGLGPLNYEARQGMYLHPTYAVTPQNHWACATLGCGYANHAMQVVFAAGRSKAHADERYKRVAEMAAHLPTT